MFLCDMYVWYKYAVATMSEKTLGSWLSSTVGDDISQGLVCSFHCGYLGSNLEVVRLIIGKCFIFLSQGSMFPGCPRTDYVDQAGLKFRDPTAELFLPSARELKSMFPAQVFVVFFFLFWTFSLVTKFNFKCPWYCWTNPLLTWFYGIK